MITLEEHVSTSYGPRTYSNAHTADLTVAVAIDYTTAGERLTHKAAGLKYLACPIDVAYIDNARALYRQCKLHNVRCLNVAGNGIYTFSQHGYRQLEINQYIYSLLKLVHYHHPFKRIRSGGQTGADIAAAVAAQKLGIDATILFPAGYRQRNEQKVDYDNRPQALLEWIQQATRDLLN